MKKKIMILFGVCFLSLFAAGCGKKDKEEVSDIPVVTVEPTKPAESGKQLVEMEKTDPEEAKKKNSIGVETPTASQMTIINRTGAEVSSIYIRPNDSDDDEWGEDLVKGQFVLKEGDAAVYFFEKGPESDLYDIRISYKEENKNECFFRKLPMNEITKITLCMDGIGEDGIPFARYFRGEGSSEYSTLDDVKRRLGLLDDYGDDEDENQKEVTDPEAQETEAPQAEPTPTEAPKEPETNVEKGIRNAEGCIGKPLSALIEACGEPNGTTYENEPETGETGYHYYNGFTVSTTVDENGNEIVAGVW